MCYYVLEVTGSVKIKNRIRTLEESKETGDDGEVMDRSRGVGGREGRGRVLLGLFLSAAT